MNTALKDTQKTCLVVDDSDMIRRVASRIVRDLGFEVLSAENGKIALETCRVSMPDAILLDRTMPVLDGLSFLKTLRTTEKDGDKPVVVFCTGERSIERIAEALNHGADEYIMKPFDSDIIETKFQLAGLI